MNIEHRTSNIEHRMGKDRGQWSGRDSSRESEVGRDSSQGSEEGQWSVVCSRWSGRDSSRESEVRGQKIGREKRKKELAAPVKCAPVRFPEPTG